MKQVIFELINQIEALEKELEIKEKEFKRLIDYLDGKGIIITYHSDYLESKLDEKNDEE